MEPDADAGARTEELVRLIAHDLRNPLTSVQLNGQLIERAAARDGLVKQERWARLIVEAARRMDDLLGKLVECERIRAGRLALPLGAVDLHELVREVGSTATVPVAWTGADAPTAVHANRARLAQSFAALVGLATQEADRDAGLHIAVDTDGDRGRCTIRVPRRAPDAAEPMADAPPAVPPGNTGGQAIVLHHARTLIESHGGTLEVARGPERDTQFTVTLPLA